MKNTVKNMFLVAAAAMGITACQKEVQEGIQAGEETVLIDFVAASADTKTSVNTTGETPVFAWGQTETFEVLEQTDALARAESVKYVNEEGKAKFSAEFTANPDKGEYKYVAVYPKSGYVGATILQEATLCLPAQQTMAEGSYDPSADLMVSEVVETSAQPTEAQMVGFVRIAAVAEMTLKGLALESGDKVQSIKFEADGKALAGNIVVDLTSPAEFVAADQTSSSVTVATTSSDKVYFTVLPAALEGGASYTVTVATDKKFYIKQGKISEGKTLEFRKGMVTRFNVDMSSVAPIDKWLLVRDASTLKEGDVVTIVAKGYDYVVGANVGSSYPYASKTKVVKKGDVLYHEGTDGKENIMQKYTLVKREDDRCAFDFYNALGDYVDDEDSGFLCVNGSNKLLLLDYYSNDTQFDISIDNNAVATICATNASGTGKYMTYYHSTYGTPYFNCYSSYTEAKHIQIYRLEGAEGKTPVVAAHVTVPDEPVVVTEDAATDKEIAGVTFDYVGDWNISVTDNADWLTVNYVDGKLYFTVDKNNTFKRDASVTIKASLEGQDDITWPSFTILQKGAPEEVTIADFMTKGQDVNVAYKITGRITEMSSPSNGTYKLSDGNGNIATVTYLYTDDGEKVYGSSIGLEVGDVVTVTTVVASSTKGKGGSSAYHSIYKGHYGIKAEAGIAADYTGGTVTIDVTTKSNGDITVPEAVTAVKSENTDFAELSYNGGNQATVTFATENATSDAREAEITFTYGQTSAAVTVKQGVNPANKIGYELVTDISSLAIGDEVIIVAKASDKALACPTKTSDTKFPSADIEKTGNVIYDIEQAGVQSFILEAGSDTGTMAFRFTYKDVTYYPYYSSGLKMRTAINAAASWTISIEEGGEAIVSTVSSSKNYLMKFNSAAASLTFTAYLESATNATKAENAICIYKKQTK